MLVNVQQLRSITKNLDAQRLRRKANVVPAGEGGKGMLDLLIYKKCGILIGEVNSGLFFIRFEILVLVGVKFVNKSATRLKINGLGLVKINRS